MVIGGSDHAKIILSILQSDPQFNILGILDRELPLHHKVMRYPVLGSIHDIPELSRSIKAFKGIIAIADNCKRRAIAQLISNIDPDFEFINALHPTSIIEENVSIGHGNIIAAGTIIRSGSSIGDHCVIHSHASIDRDCTITDYSSIDQGTILGRCVNTCSCTTVSMGATIVSGITIGPNNAIHSNNLLSARDIAENPYNGKPGSLIREFSSKDKELDTPQFNTSEYQGSPPCRIKIITEESEWKATLKSIGHSDVYHSFEYHNISKGKMQYPILIRYTHNNTIIALPFLIRKIEGTPYYDATSVYGYCGPVSTKLDSSFDKPLFKRTFINFLHEKKIIAVFSRLNPFIENQEAILEGIGKLHQNGLVVNIDLTLNKELQRQRYGRRLKTHLNKARRACFVREAETQDELERFIELYYENMDRVKAGRFYYFPYQYFLNLWRSRSFNTRLLVAIHRDTGKIIAGSMFMRKSNVLHYHLSGSADEYLHLTPSKLLIDEMRIRTNDKACTYYNLGGGIGGSSCDSLFKFKSSFSKDFKPFRLWQFITNEEVYSHLVAGSMVTTKRFSYFPLYRTT